MKETLWITLGFVSFILGIVGVILPILPTTPFLILTGYSFNKGSKTLSNWLMKQAVYQKYRNIKLTKQKKQIINYTVDVLLVFYIYLFQGIFIKALLIVLIALKHFVFYKFIHITYKVEN